MKKLLLFTLLLASIVPIIYIGYILVNFGGIAKQDWMYNRTYSYLKIFYMFILIVIYINWVKNNTSFSQKDKNGWYIALVLASPIAMPIYWIKYGCKKLAGSTIT